MRELTLRQAREERGLSLREAARKLGITHAYLSALELGHKPLQEERLVELEKLYGLQKNIKLVQPLLQNKDEFVSWLRAQIKWWDSRFVLPMIPAVTRLITDLYVPPRFQNDAGSTKSREEILGAFFTDKKNRGLLLSGSIGSGKSFFLRMLALATEDICAEAGINTVFVPILVSLGEFSLSQGSLLQSLSGYYKEQGYEGSVAQLESYLGQAIKRGNALLLFDGLDEIHSSSKRAETFARLQHHFESSIRPTGSKLVITGRKEAFFEGDRNYDGFVSADILRWQARQMFESCARWSWDDQIQGKRFWQIIQANDPLFTLASWPLLFHLLATLYSCSGTAIFQDLAGLCDSCSKVLEESWNSARRSLARGENENTALPEGANWLRWRHFLIFLMDRTLSQVLAGAPNFNFSFSARDMRRAWEDFLLRRGVTRESTSFTRLESMLANSNRIGPIFLNREVVRDGECTRLCDEFHFVDPLFGHYYLAKALINRLTEAEDIFARFARQPEWERALALMLQELGRSERVAENETGERLIDQIMHREESGHYAFGRPGLFLAMRAIATFNPDRYWKRIAEPFLELYMTSIYERDVSIAFSILGEYSASSAMKDYFVRQHRKLAEDSARGIENDLRWRTLAALAKVQENTDEIVDEIVENISLFLNKGVTPSLNERISLRRLFWSLRQIGRLLMSNDSQHRRPTRGPSTSIESLRQAIMQFVHQSKERFESELKAGQFSDFHVWDELLVVLQTQRKLAYDADLHETLELFGELFDRVLSEEELGRYPHRQQLLQFLKAMARHAFFMDARRARRLAQKVRIVAGHASEDDAHELLIISILLARRETLAQSEINLKVLFNEICGTVDQGKLVQWIEEIECQNSEPHESLLRFAHAIWAIEQSNEELWRNYPMLGERALAALAAALTVELALEPPMREHERIYTTPFTDYGFPLYDHLYNAIVRLHAGRERFVEAGDAVVEHGLRLRHGNL